MAAPCSITSSRAPQLLLLAPNWRNLPAGRCPGSISGFRSDRPLCRHRRHFVQVKNEYRPSELFGHIPGELQILSVLRSHSRRRFQQPQSILCWTSIPGTNSSDLAELVCSQSGPNEARPMTNPGQVPILRLSRTHCTKYSRMFKRCEEKSSSMVTFYH